MLGVVRAPDFSDFNTVYVAARAIDHGQDPYSVAGLMLRPFAAHYKYPPLLAAALSSLLMFSFGQLAWAFVWLSLLLYAAAFLMMLWIFGAALRSATAAMLAIGFLVWQPSIDTLAGAQQEFGLLFLFTLSCWALTRSQTLEVLAGGAIALCAIIKVYPALMIVDFGIRRWWKAVIGFAVVILLLSLFSVLRTGLALQLEFWFRVFPILRGGTATDENQGLMGFFDRFYVDGVTVDETLLTSVPAATLLYHIACVCLLIVSFAVLIRSRFATDAFKILIPAMLMMAPASWIHYEELMLLPFGLLLGERRGEESFWENLLFFAAFCLVAFGNEVTVMNVSWRILHSYKFYGVFLFWVMGLRSALARARGRGRGA